MTKMSVSRRMRLHLLQQVVFKLSNINKDLVGRNSNFALFWILSGVIAQNDGYVLMKCAVLGERDRFHAQRNVNIIGTFSIDAAFAFAEWNLGPLKSSLICCSFAERQNSSPFFETCDLSSEKFRSVLGKSVWTRFPQKNSSWCKCIWACPQLDKMASRKRLWTFRTKWRPRTNSEQFYDDLSPAFWRWLRHPTQFRTKGTILRPKTRNFAIAVPKSVSLLLSLCAVGPVESCHS